LVSFFIALRFSKKSDGKWWEIILLSWCLHY
jgi:hypothetical protein